MDATGDFTLSSDNATATANIVLGDFSANGDITISVTGADGSFTANDIDGVGSFVLNMAGYGGSANIGALGVTDLA